MTATVMMMAGAQTDDSAGPDVPAAEVQSEILRLFGEYGHALYRFCCFTLRRRDEAEDVVQDVFLRLVQHLQVGGDRTNLRAWLFTVAANACRDRTRWRARLIPWRPEQDRRTIEPPDEGPDRQLARAALRSLGSRDRLLLSLRAQGLSYRELAAAAGVQEKSVGRLLARAVDRWRRRIQQSTEPESDRQER